MRIHLDACALNRLLDDQRQPRIRREAEVIEDIFGLISENRVRWIGGAVLEAEIARTPDDQKRKNALFLLELADEKPRLLRGTLARAAVLEQAGYGAFDALHLAMAEEAAADVLLTTDDRCVRLARRWLGSPTVTVMNPVNWLKDRKP